MKKSKFFFPYSSHSLISSLSLFSLSLLPFSRINSKKKVQKQKRKERREAYDLIPFFFLTLLNPSASHEGKEAGVKSESDGFAKVARGVWRWCGKLTTTSSCGVFAQRTTTRQWKFEGILPTEKGCHRLRGRKAGSSLYLDAHIVVDPFLSVSAAHEIGEKVRHQIQCSDSQIAEVFIHTDPSFLQPASIPDQSEHLEHTGVMDYPSKDKEIEAIVAGIILSKYAEKMTVEYITRHSLQGKILLEIQVSMPLEMSIRDAMKIASEAEKEILNASPCISQVSIQLTLGNPIPLVHSPRSARNIKQGNEQ